MARIRQSSPHACLDCHIQDSRDCPYKTARLSDVAHIRQSSPDWPRISGDRLRVGWLNGHTLAGLLWEGFRKSRIFSTDTYPESYIAEYSLTYEDHSPYSLLSCSLFAGYLPATGGAARP